MLLPVRLSRSIAHASSRNDYRGLLVGWHKFATKIRACTQFWWDFELKIPQIHPIPCDVPHPLRFKLELEIFQPVFGVKVHLDIPLAIAHTS